MVTGSETFRTTAAYRTKSEDFPEFGLNRHSTAKYVRYHDARESGEKQELIFRNEYDISWWPQSGSSNWHFLEVDVNAKTVDCIVEVYHVEDEDGNLAYEHHVLKEQEYEDFMRGRSDRSLEAAFRLSETPFENADRQPWSLNNGKILYASDIKIARSASEVIFDVLHDFLVINTVEMGGKTLRVRLEDRKMIKSLSDAEDYWEVGSERRGLVGSHTVCREHVHIAGETFYVDLETKWDGPDGKKKYIDITCGFYELGSRVPKYACAIELKFKRKDYGALPHNLFAIYRDIESLEREVMTDGNVGEQKYSEGRFYFLTNNEDYCNKAAYVNKSKQETDGASRYKAFGLNGEKTRREVVYHPEKGSEEDRKVELKNEYELVWEQHKGDSSDDNWYFLEIDIVG